MNASRFRARRALDLLVPLLLSATALPAQAPVPALAVQVFSDTASARIEIILPAGARPAPVRAAIRAIPDGSPLWEGTLGLPVSAADGSLTLSRTLDGLRTRVWSPSSPQRYALQVEAGSGATTLRQTVRFGFRRFEERTGRLFLNGKPVFLRGNAINPPGRTIPDSLDDQRQFAADWVTYLKRINVNVIRLAETSQVWLDVCDSLGMMVFQGLYGKPRGGSGREPPAKPFAEVLADYHAVFDPLVNHPSVVIYVLSNEVASRDVMGLEAGADTMAAFLTRVYRALQEWDPTRAYIGNAGFGFGRSGDICDMHHYWGWYYNTVLSYYTLRDPRSCWRSERPQPLTVSEGVGSYTGPDGRFNLVSDSKQLSAQLNFTGHAPDHEQAARAQAYQTFAARNAIEIMRRTRRSNPYLAGIMPFTIPFARWWDIGSFADMVPKPVAEQLAISYRPILLSWELWTPQVYAGTTLRPTVHVVNDDTLGHALHDLSFRWRMLNAAGRVWLAGESELGDVAYFDGSATSLRIPLPDSLHEGTYTLAGELLSGGRAVSGNSTTVFVAPRTYSRSGPIERRLRLYDPIGRTAAALRALAVPFAPFTPVAEVRPAEEVLVIGAQAWDSALDSVVSRLRAFVQAGGRVLVLAQDAARFDGSWLNARVRMLTDLVDDPRGRRPGSPYRNAMAVNPERPGHPVFEGVDRDRLFLWSDPDGWTERDPGFPAVYPVTHGFVLDGAPADLANVALLADYGPGLQGVALAEIFDGAGSVMLCGLDLIGHAGMDPAADRLLANAVRYVASASAHEPHPLITSPIIWGEYGSERGLVVGVYHGLTLNTVPVVPAGLQEQFPWRITAEGWQFAGAGGSGWNSRPAITYAAHGRRAFGPYTLDLYNTPLLPNDRELRGAGEFRARVLAGTRRMITIAENPAAEALPLEIVVNGAATREMIPAGQTVRIEVPVTAPETVQHVRYVADRRVVLLRTEFS